MVSDGARKRAFVSLTIVLLLGSSVVALGSDALERAPLNPAFEAYLENLRTGESRPLELETGQSLGYIPSPIGIPRGAGVPSAEPLGTVSLPATYDLRTQNRVTAVRNQGGCGSCWAFASFASLESWLRGQSQTWDLSENNLKECHGLSFTPCEGGDVTMSTAYVARLSGPVREADDPYRDYPTGCTSGLAPRLWVKDVLRVPDNDSTPLDNAYLKRLIVDYGAAYTSMYWSNSYYNSGQYAYYYNGAAWGNHAVAIVGWDDTFSRTRFVSPSPPGDGAWIVRNSWGSSWGESGYFYVSYYDTRFGEENGAFANAIAPGDVAAYQYDRLGWTGSYGYGTRTAWGAAVFTASAAGSLFAVGTYAVDSNTAYEIRIKAALTGTTLSSTTGTFTHAGYHVVPLGTPVSLTAGASFAVVVKYTALSSTYPIPAEDRITDCSDGAIAGSGETYISSNGSSWSDLAADFPNSSVCIKAFVTPSSPPTGGPVGYWRMNEGAGSTASDSSGSGNAGTISGATWTTSADASGALAFNGTSSYVQVPNSPTLNPTTALTIEAWIKPSALPSGQSVIVEKASVSHTSPYYQYTLMTLSSEIKLWVAVSGTYRMVTSTGAGLVVGRWYHVAGLFDGSSLKVYVDGVLKGSASIAAGTLDAYATEVLIGKHRNVTTERFQGTVDEVRLSNRSLTPSEFDLLPAGGLLSPATDEFTLTGVHVIPNPVREAGEARFLAQGMGIESVRAEVYALSGQKLYSGPWESGSEIAWEAVSADGALLSNGVYIVVLWAHRTGFQERIARATFAVLR